MNRIEEIEREKDRIENQIFVLLHTQPFNNEEFARLKEKKTILDREQNDLHMENLKEKGSAAVYADAEKYLKDFLDYIFYNSYMYTAGSIVRAPVFRFSDDFIEKTYLRKYKVFNPAGPQILLEESDIKDYIKNYVLHDHRRLLKGTPEEKQLNRLIRDTLKNADFVQSFNKTATNYAAVLLSSNTLPVYRDAAFDEIARISRGLMEEEYTQNEYGESIPSKLTYSNGWFSMEILDVSKLSKNVSIGTHKLLIIALAVFTGQYRKLERPKNNHIPEYQSCTVIFPADKYIRLLGYDIDEKTYRDPKDQAAEHLRAQRVRSEARRQISQELELLHNIRITIKKGRSTANYTITPTTKLEGNDISVTFNPEIIAYLALLPSKTRYALWMLRIPVRQSNTYRIALKMMNQYTIQSNHLVKGLNKVKNCNRLKVKTLLKCTDLPTVEELSKKVYGADQRNEARKWKARIKKPFETAVNNLLDLEAGGLKSWHYEITGNGKISQEEVDAIASFSEYAELVVVYDLAEPPTDEEIGLRHNVAVSFEE